jgi:hypothetical protein
MVALATPITIGTQMAGDWIFPNAGHVGIYIGGGQYINAPTEGQNVKISSVPASLYAVGRFYPPTSEDMGIKSAAIGSAGIGLVTGLGKGIELGLEGLGLAGQAAGQGLAEANPLAGVGKALAWLSDTKNWWRIGMVVGGAVCLALGAASIAGRAAL